MWRNCISLRQGDCVTEPLTAAGAGLMPEIHAMERAERLSGAVNGFLYQVEISTDRAASDYTPRIRPWMKHVNIPLEETHILWMK